MYHNKNSANKNKTKEMFEKIIDNLQNIVNTGEYTKFLKFQKNFRGYSFNNLILIFSQFPDATKVAGKKKWLSLGRTIIDGTKRIWIIAPIPRQYEKKVQKIVDDEKIEETEIIKYNMYRYVYVYDISQTEGKPLPLQTNLINCNDMIHFYEKLKNFSTYPVSEQDTLGGIKGYYNPKDKTIVIKKNLSVNDKAAVLLHELSHAMYDDFDYKSDRNLSEVFVESIAYIVADYFGLDTSMCSFNYIAQWAKGEPKLVIELGSKIQKCANQFIDKLEEYETQKIKQAA